MVVEYGQSVHTQLEAPGQPGPAGEATDLIRSMALSSAELWHDVLQRLAELQESQVVLAHAIAELGAMVRESLPARQAPELTGVAPEALPESTSGELPPEVQALVDLATPVLDTFDASPFSTSSEAFGTADAESTAGAGVTAVAPQFGPVEEVSQAEVGRTVEVVGAVDDVDADVSSNEALEAPVARSAEESRRRRRFRRRAHTVEPVADHGDEPVAAVAEPVAGPSVEPTAEPLPVATVAVADEEYPPLPPPPTDETWEPVAAATPLPAWPPPDVAFTGPVSDTAVEEQAPAADAWAPLSFPASPVGAAATPPAPAPDPSPSVTEAAEPAPTFSLMEPPAPPAGPPFSIMEPPAPPAGHPFSIMEPPAPPARPEPLSLSEPASPAGPPLPTSEPPSAASEAPAPAAIVYVPATAETAMVAPATAAFVTDPAAAPEPAGVEPGLPPLPPPPVGAEGVPAPASATTGPEPVAATVPAETAVAPGADEAPVEEPALVGVAAGQSQWSASMATEILASAPAHTEGTTEQPGVLMVSEDLTLVSKSRKRRLQFRLR